MPGSSLFVATLILSLLIVPVLNGTLVSGDSTTVEPSYRTVAVKDVCAWPNLTLLPDGTVIAVGFNQPRHGGVPGDVNCWASTDQGRTWEPRGTAVQRPHPDSYRVNHAVGMASNGDIIVISSGYKMPGGRYENILPTVVCRSADGGRTWALLSDLARTPDGRILTPFGDIVPGNDGALRMTGYTYPQASVFILRSEDDGRTWGDPTEVAPGINECDILHLGEGRWLLAGRTSLEGATRLFRSQDDGVTWQDQGLVAPGGRHPADLERLADGRILLTYGNRVRHGIEVKLSSDDGATWSDPIRLTDLPATDLGYPSSVQLPDGQIVSAYYAGTSDAYAGYQMGVIVWTPPSVR